MSLSRLVPLVVSAVSVVVLGVGCSGLLPTPPEAPPASFVLAPKLASIPPASGVSGSGPTLLVSRPEPSAGYGTQRMAYLEQDYRLDYFADHQWVEPPAAMLEPLLVQALGAHPAFGAVSAGGRGIRASLRLDTVIEALYQDFRPRPSRGRVALRVRLVDLGSGRIIDTRLIEDSEPAPSDDAYGGVQAINRALGRLLPEIADLAGRTASRSRSGGTRDPDSHDEDH